MNLPENIWFNNFIGFGISWGKNYERRYYICFDLPFVTIQIFFKRRNRKMAKEKKIICGLKALYYVARENSNYYLFENMIGSYFGYCDTAKKPELEVEIRIKSEEEQR